MLSLDGSIVEVGDNVFDTIHGPGVVIELMDFTNAIIVQFPNGRSFTYKDTGVGPKPFKTLYWGRPVAYTPNKGDSANPNWDRFARIVQKIAGELL